MGPITERRAIGEASEYLRTAHAAFLSTAELLHSDSLRRHGGHVIGPGFL